MRVLKTFILQLAISSLLMSPGLMAGKPTNDPFEILGLEMPKNPDVHSVRLLRKKVDELEAVFFSEGWTRGDQSKKSYHSIEKPWGMVNRNSFTVLCYEFYAPECQWAPLTAVREWISQFYPEEEIARDYGPFPQTMREILDRIGRTCRDRYSSKTIFYPTQNPLLLDWARLAIQNLVTQNPWGLIDCTSQPNYYHAQAAFKKFDRILAQIERSLRNTSCLRRFVGSVDPVRQQLEASLNSDQAKVAYTRLAPEELGYYLLVAGVSETTFGHIIADIHTICNRESVPAADRPRLKSKAIHLYSLLERKDLPPALRPFQQYCPELLTFIVDPSIPTLTGQNVTGSYYWSIKYNETSFLQRHLLFPRWDTNPDGLSHQFGFRWTERLLLPTPPAEKENVIPQRIPHGSLEAAFRARREVHGEDPSQVVISAEFKETKIKSTRPLKGKPVSWNMRTRPDNSWVGPKEYKGDAGKYAAKRIAHVKPADVRESWARRSQHPETGVPISSTDSFLNRGPYVEGAKELSEGQKLKAHRETAENLNEIFGGLVLPNRKAKWEERMFGSVDKDFTSHFAPYPTLYKEGKDPSRPGVALAKERARMVMDNDLYGGCVLSDMTYCDLPLQPWDKAGTHPERLAAIKKETMYGPSDTTPRKPSVLKDTPVRKWLAVDASAQLLRKPSLNTGTSARPPVVDANTSTPQKPLLGKGIPVKTWPPVDTKSKVRYIGEEGDKSYTPVPWDVELQQLREYYEGKKQAVPSA